MTDELKDQRVVTMMSPSELEMIDDWMFKSRLRSRGEAIRRLCQIGIVAQEHDLMPLALAALSHYMKKETPSDAGVSFASGESLEFDLKKLVLAVIETESKMVGFKTDKTIEEAIESAKILTRDYAGARAKSPIHKPK